MIGGELGLAVHIVLLIVTIIFVVLAVEYRNLLRAAISLGVASGMLAIIFYQLDSPFAAVIELSVCAGLITILFIAVISLTGGKEVT